MVFAGSKSGKAIHGKLISIHDAIHHCAVNVGDAFEIVTEISGVEPVERCSDLLDDHKAGLIVTTSHALIDQHDNVCFSVVLRSRIDNITEIAADIPKVSVISL